MAQFPKMQKIQYFEYVMYKLVEWHREATGQDKNDLSKLKVMKLLFFVCTASVQVNKENSLLDEVFDNFVAMPYGPVESDVYNQLPSYINNEETQFPSRNNEPEIDNFSTLIQDSVNLLRGINPRLITMRAFDLVDLTHKWSSWERSYKLANSLGKASQPMNIDEIKSDIPSYHLLPY